MVRGKGKQDPRGDIWGENDRKDKKEIYERLKDLIKPAEKDTIIRNQFYNFRQHASFSFFQNWTSCMSYVSLMIEAYVTHTKAMEMAAKELHMKDALTIAVTDHKLREEFRKVKGADNTFTTYEEACRLWDLDNSIRDAFKQNKTITSQDIQALSNHQSKTSSDDRVIKSYKLSGKGHNIKQYPAKDKTCSRCKKWAILHMNVDLLQAFPKVHRFRNYRESHRSG